MGLKHLAMGAWYNKTMTTHRLYEVGITPTKITPDGTHSGMDITIQNVDATRNVYIGADGVTSTNYGYRILPNHAWSVELSGMDDLYICGDAAGQYAAVLKVKLEAGQ